MSDVAPVHPHPHDYLSPRECDVLVLLAIGLTNHEIADTLGFSHGTMRNYISRIFAKLGVTNRVLAAIHPFTLHILDTQAQHPAGSEARGRRTGHDFDARALRTAR